MKIVADTNIPYVKECFSSFGEVKTIPDREITHHVVSDADVLLVRSVTRVNAELLDQSKIKFIGTPIAGTDHIDKKYLIDRNIGFASAPGSNSNSVAEYVISALFYLAQKYNIQLKGKSIGIIGVGNIGSKVEKKSRSLGMDVYLNDPPLQRKTGDNKYRPLNELFQCDFITIHTPLTYEGIDKTFHLADSNFFELIKKGAFFLNTSRGAVIDTDAVKKTIINGNITGTVFDVWEDEPNIDIELLKMVDISTPHIAGFSFDGRVKGMIMVYEAMCHYFGIKATKQIAAFLPQPEIPKIQINKQNIEDQEILHKSIEQVYSIKKDNENMRKILNLSNNEQSDFFKHLRLNYPRRREFQNTTIILPHKEQALLTKLAGIGFHIE
jgi:erythronate-4-phosphate dehydrogenase